MNLNSKAEIKDMGREGFLIGGKLIERCDLIKVLYIEYNNYLINKNESVVSYLKQLYDLFLNPNLGIYILTGIIYEEEVLYGWDFESYTQLIDSYVHNKGVIDLIDFASYVPLYWELQLSRWLYKYGESNDYSFLNETISHCLGLSPALNPINCIYDRDNIGQDWNDLYPNLKSSHLLIEANNDEYNYLLQTYDGINDIVDDYKQAVINHKSL